jgi:hypothetical protein
MGCRLYLFLPLVIFTTLLASNLFCLKRINNITSESGSYNWIPDEFHGSESWQEKYFYYETANPELIDSVVVHLHAITTVDNVVVSEIDSTYTLDYTGEVITVNGNRQYSYYRSDGYSYTFTRDSQYRIIYKAPDIYNNPGTHYSWTYNANGRLDEFTWQYNLEDINRWEFNYADDQNSPVQSVTAYYYLPDIGWFYDSSSSYAYPAENYATPYYLYTEEAFDVARLFFQLRFAVNPFYQASSYGAYEITGSNTPAGYQVLVENEGDTTDNTFELVYNTDGYVSQYNSSGSSLYSSSSITYGFIWDDFVENEDIISPEIVPLTSYPNPFNNHINICYTLGKDSDISLSVYNIKGQKLRTLFRGKQSKGSHSLTWDGANNDGQMTACGIYLIRLETDSNSPLTGKVMLSR